MVREFARKGVRFQYPENWKLEREDTERGWTVHVQSPNTTFFLLSYDEGMPPPEQMVGSVVEALKEEYSDLESDERVDTLAGLPAVGRDIQFTSLDLTNTCYARSFATGEATVLVLWQAADLDLEETEPVLQAICRSIEVAED